MDDKWLARGEVTRDSAQKNVQWCANNLDKRKCFLREAQVIRQINWGNVIVDWVAGSCYENETEPALQCPVVNHIPEDSQCLFEVGLRLLDFLRSTVVVQRVKFSGWVIIVIFLGG